MLYDRTVLVEILARLASDINKETYISHAAFPDGNGGFTPYVKINIQPASKNLIALSDGILGKVYSGYVTKSGVVETMRLTVSGTNDHYIVRGREPYDYGMLRHYELMLSKGGV